MDTYQAAATWSPPVQIRHSTPLPNSIDDVDRVVRESVAASVLGGLDLGEPLIDARLDPDEVAGTARWRNERFGFHLQWWPGATAISIRFEDFSVEELRADDSMSWHREFGPGELSRAIVVAGDILAGCALHGPRLVHPAMLQDGRCGHCYAEGTLRHQTPHSARHLRLVNAGLPQVIHCHACSSRWMAPHRDDPDAEGLESVPSTPPPAPFSEHRRLFPRPALHET